MKVYPNSSIGQLSSPSHPVFQYIEQRFWRWIECASHDVKDMYFSEDAIYEKKGAIIQAIENVIEEANETGKPVILANADIECAFE